MPRLIDTTLREGEQTPGLHLCLTAKKRLFAGLTKTGVDEIELGMASAANPDLAELVSFADTHFPLQPFSLWCRCRKEDIRLAASLRPSVLALSIPTSDLHLKKKLKRDRAWASAQVATSIRLALALGVPKVALGLEDASRADHGFLVEITEIARGAGAFRIRIADTVGIADPAMIAELVELLAGSGLEVAVHCHNDFGMATANTINAFAHGAQWGDVTLLGLGERAGNSRIEEVMSYLTLKKGVGKYNIEELMKLSRMVAQETDRKIPPHQPLLGSDIFTCESGIHQHGILADPITYEPFAPELVGTQRKLLMGAGSGRHGLAATLERLQLASPEDNDLYRLWQRMRSKAAQLHRPLHDLEIQQLTVTLASSAESVG